MNEKLNAAIEEAKKELAAVMSKKHHWHDYQDHCHNCGQEDAVKYPYCLPYDDAKFLAEKMQQAYALGMDAGAESAVWYLSDHVPENLVGFVVRIVRNKVLEAARTAYKV